MKTTLMPTQAEDVPKIIAGEDIPNFSEPGTGKTINTIACIEAADLYSGLIICPPVATLMWKRNLEIELGARVQHLETRATEIDKTADFLVSSYGMIEDHFAELYKRNNAALVIDESQYLKNMEANRTRVVFGEEVDGKGGIYETSQQCWLLSGTPIERYADDLFSQLRATQPDVLARINALTLDSFQMQFCHMELKQYPGGASRRVSTANQNEALLNAMLYKYIGAVRRTMAEVDPFMPPAVERDIFVKHKNMKELAAILHGKTRDQIMKALIDGDIHLMIARRLMGLAKLRSGVDYIKMESRNHPLLVGFWHDDVGTAIAEQVPNSALIKGNTSTAARETIRKRFIAGEVGVLVGQIQAMGVAMDGLQEVCHHAIVFENDWSAAKIEQFYKRLARKGQGLHTQVDFIKCGLELEDLIDEIRVNKRDGTKLIIG